jgi:hypothetical protein
MLPSSIGVGTSSEVSWQGADGPYSRSDSPQCAQTVRLLESNGPPYLKRVVVLPSVFVVA